MPRTYTRRPVIDRVMEKVVERDGHWLWTGSVGSSGYGKVNGEPEPGRRNGRPLLTHRVVWEHHNGPIPDGLVLDHTDGCLTILCCNPAHLEPVTQAENRRRQAARRTSCDKGHPYTLDSARTGPRGRECRTCAAEREAGRRARNRRPDYAEVCDRGHRRTDENTVAQGSGLRCKDCTSEAARARRHRERQSRESGSGSAPS